MKVEGHTIPEGFSEEEIWKIFDIVYSHLKADDEIYFDVTHAFRSIPMFSTVLFNYAHFMKNTIVKSVHYGAFEKLGPSYKVKKMPLEKRVAPLIELTNIVRLQEYTDMASSFKNYGRVKDLSEGLKENNDNGDSVIRQIAGGIKQFDDNLVANRMSAIKQGKVITAIKNNIRAVNRRELPTPIKHIIRSFGESLSDFVREESNANIEAAIKWVREYQMLPQCYTMGQEYIISRVAELLADRNPYTQGRPNENRREFREYVSSLCSIPDEDVEAENYRNQLAEHKELTTELLKMPVIVRVRENFAQLGIYRNALNHAKGDVAIPSS